MTTDPILHFFHFAHLPAALQSASKPFCDLAAHIVETLPRNAERTVALRKLLEAKDAAVRANVGSPPAETFMTRLEREHDDLKARLGKLREFLAGEQQGASPVQVSYLVDQADAMENYLSILNDRLEDLEEHDAALVASVDIGEAREVGGHDIDRDGPMPFGG
jgi:hypothetical protein